MHAILITFRPEAPEPQMMEALEPHMEKIAATPGLIMKTFVAPDPETWGGFHLFTDEAAAGAYLEGEFFQWLSGTDLTSKVEAKHFHVEDDPSKAFGTPSVPLAESRAA